MLPEDSLVSTEDSVRVVIIVGGVAVLEECDILDMPSLELDIRRADNNAVLVVYLIIGDTLVIRDAIVDCRGVLTTIVGVSNLDDRVVRLVVVKSDL